MSTTDTLYLGYLWVIGRESVSCGRLPIPRRKKEKYNFVLLFVVVATLLLIFSHLLPLVVAPASRFCRACHRILLKVRIFQPSWLSTCLNKMSLVYCVWSWIEFNIFFTSLLYICSVVCIFAQIVYKKAYALR